MAQLIVVVGYVSGSKRGTMKILTLDGAQFEVEESQILQSFPVDTNKDGARRLFFDPDAVITVSVKASEAFGRSAKRQYIGQTIYKYLDDGGTISKSRDDEGPLPKSPWDDGPPKSPWDDNPPKDPIEDQSRK